MKSIIMQNSQMQEGQNEHDEHYGYGHLRVDLVMQALGNASTVVVTDEYKMISSSFEHVIFELQARRSTASVPPVSSTKPRE